MFILEPAHGAVIRGDAAPLRVVQDRRGAGFINDVVLCILQIGAFLLPEEEDMEARHQRRELIRDILEHLGILLERVYQAGISFKDPFGYGERGHFLQAVEEVRFTGATVGGAKEENAVGTGIDGVQVSDFCCSSAHGVC